MAHLPDREGDDTVRTVRTVLVLWGWGQGAERTEYTLPLSSIFASIRTLSFSFSLGASPILHRQALSSSFGLRGLHGLQSSLIIHLIYCNACANDRLDAGTRNLPPPSNFSLLPLICVCCSWRISVDRHSDLLHRL